MNNSLPVSLALAVICVGLLVALLRKSPSAGGSLTESDLLALTQKVLDEQAAKLSEQAKEARERQEKEDSLRRESLDQLLKPLQENLEKVQTKLQSLDTQRAELKQQLDDYRDLGKELNEKTTQLGNALRRPEIRGRWGEMQLRKLVELAGMTSYVDFHEQITLDEDDDRIRPDMVVTLSEGAQIAVDSKVPLDGYLDAVGLHGEERDQAMQKVSKQIKSHIKQLSDKAYWQTLEKSANFTVMFIPIEGAFHEAVAIDHDLMEYAANHKISIATPFTLLGLLSTIARLETQFQIAQEIDVYLKEARKLHKRAEVFVDHLGKAQKSVSTANKHVDAAARSFDRNFMKSISDMNSMALASGKTDELDASETLLEITEAEFDNE
jgi:DNA recombination protein RmuC